LKNYEELNDIQIDVLKEIGNILGSSYINSIATLTGLKDEQGINRWHF